MILFVGAQDRGFFIRETAAMRKMDLVFIDSRTTIKTQINLILEQSADYIVFDIEQYIDSAEELAEEIYRMQRAKNCSVIIYAPGYDKNSRIIQELLVKGFRFFVFSGNQSEARAELERCLEGYFEEPKKETLEEAKLREQHRSSIKKVGITGACKRMGTTTFALQCVKYLQLKGYKACYVEVNSTGFVLQHEKSFNVEHDPVSGKVHFENVDMFYKQDRLLDVLKQDYEYFVYDYGTYMDTNFNKTSFLEKDIRIFVMGSKAAEMPYTNELLRNEYYTDVEYVFNFISEKEKAELLEYMEEKAEHTHFTVYTPDQFEYIPNEAFEKLLPVEDISKPEGKKKKKGLFAWKK